MRRVVRASVLHAALLLTCCGFGMQDVRAQTKASLEGVWKGEIQTGRVCSVTLKFLRTASDAPWAGEMGTCENSEKLSVTEIEHAQTAISFAVPSLGAHFQGQMAADGTEITGKWIQGAVAVPLKLRQDKNADEVTTAKHRNMPKDAHPKFEVATIKPSNPDRPKRGFGSRGQHVFAVNERLLDLIAIAYGAPRSMVVNLKGWATSEFFDVDGIPDIAGEPNLEQMRAMYKDLLATRFGLKLHAEKQMLPAYVLELSKAPLRITKSLGDPQGAPDQVMTHWSQESATLRETNATMKDFLAILCSTLDRPCVDATGLEGRYDFVLTWAPNEMATESDNPAKAPSLFTALAEMGMKLHGEKASCDVLVVDQVNRPSEN